MQQNISALERDGLNTRVVTVTLIIPDENFDTAEAVRNACTAFYKTEAGRKIYEGNCGGFNWGDFIAEVPNEICEQFGFTKLENNITSDLEVDFCEHLVNDDAL